MSAPPMCSFTRAPPLAASVQSDLKRNFVVLNLLFLIVGAVFFNLSSPKDNRDCPGKSRLEAAPTIH